jgi:hypothetical protein
MKINNYHKSVGIGLLGSILFFLILGAVSAVFSNPFFARMTPVSNLDLVLLILTSILAGSYIGLYYFIKNQKTLSITCATSGGVLGFLAFACPVCNKLILLVLGFSGAMTYFAPLQPILGVLGVLLLLYANYSLIKILKNGK